MDIITHFRATVYIHCSIAKTKGNIILNEYTIKDYILKIDTITS